MESKILIKRGLKANLPQLDIGELAFTTDTNELFIGSSNGNIKTNVTSTSLAQLSDVTVTQPSNGNVLTFQNGKWVPEEITSNSSGTDGLITEIFSDTETVTIIDTTPPQDVIFLPTTNLVDTHFTLNWNLSKSSDVDHYNIYVNSNLVGSVGNYTKTFNVTGLTYKTTYVVKVTCVDFYGNESAGSTINITTSDHKYYLIMDGKTTKFATPKITFDEVIVDCSISSTQPNGNSASLFNDGPSYVTFAGAKSNNLSMYWNGSLVVMSSIPRDIEGVLRIKLSSADSAVTAGLLCNGNGGASNYAAGLLYTATFYKSGTVVAVYDFTKGNVNDQSGNGYAGVLTGGSWGITPQ